MKQLVCDECGSQKFIASDDCWTIEGHVQYFQCENGHFMEVVTPNYSRAPLQDVFLHDDETMRRRT